MVSKPSCIVLLATLTMALSHVALGAEKTGQGNVARGRAFAFQHCSLCHAIGRIGASSYVPAPPFRTLHERYDVEGLAEAFAEGVVVPHDGPRQMPRFMLSPGEIDDLLAYLKSLERPATRRSTNNR